MNKPKRDYTAESRKALKILSALLKHLAIAEKHIHAVIRMESADK